MVNLGNAWHLPGNPEPPGRAGMRDPVFPADPVPAVSIFSGNQYQGDGNAGNQLQDGSTLFFRPATDTSWQTAPLVFATAADNNNYYAGSIPVAVGTVEYYLRIAYDDHDTTFLRAAADNMTSVTTADETAAQAAPFTFTIATAGTPGQRGQWSDLFALENVAVLIGILWRARARVRRPRRWPGRELNPEA